MKTWTIAELLAERPCALYDEARITTLFAGRERLSLLDILRSEIPAADRLWVATRPGALAPRVREAWVAEISDRVVRWNARHCGIPSVESWAMEWLDGSDRTEAVARAVAASSASASASSEAAASAAWVEAAEEAAEAAAAVEARAAERVRLVANLLARVEAEEDALGKETP